MVGFFFAIAVTTPLWLLGCRLCFRWGVAVGDDRRHDRARSGMSLDPRTWVDANQLDAAAPLPAQRGTLHENRRLHDLVEEVLPILDPDYEWPAWGSRRGGPRWNTGLRSGMRLRLVVLAIVVGSAVAELRGTPRRLLARDPLAVGAAVDEGLASLAPPVVEPVVESESVEMDVLPSPSPARWLGRVPMSTQYTYPWTLPPEPGLGDHYEDEPTEPIHHAADPLTDSGVWLGIVAQLHEMGVDVDPLVLPCSHCEGQSPDEPHPGCPGLLVSLHAAGGGVVTRYYFAARYNRHPEMRERRAELLAAIPDAVVTSRWIDCHGGELDASYTPEVLNAKPEECWRHVQADLEDLAQANAIVSFTGDGGGGKGGRHIEHGVAIALNDRDPWAGTDERPFRLIVVGPRENIFHCHPETEVYTTFAEFLAHEIAEVAR